VSILSLQLSARRGSRALCTAPNAWSNPIHELPAVRASNDLPLTDRLVAPALSPRLGKSHSGEVPSILPIHDSLVAYTIDKNMLDACRARRKAKRLLQPSRGELSTLGGCLRACLVSEADLAHQAEYSVAAERAKRAECEARCRIWSTQHGLRVSTWRAKPDGCLARFGKDSSHTKSECGTCIATLRSRARKYRRHRICGVYRVRDTHSCEVRVSSQYALGELRWKDTRSGIQHLVLDAACHARNLLASASPCSPRSARTPLE
jgi:hypothetical protein